MVINSHWNQNVALDGQEKKKSRNVALNNVFDLLFTSNNEKHRFKALLAVANSKDFDLGAKSDALNIVNNLLKFETILTALVPLKYVK